jgi:hypothetical protein
MFSYDLLTHTIEYFTQDNFAQVFGFLWMATVLTAYLQKDDYTVKKLMLLSSLFWGTHFYMLWVYSWLAAIVIWVLRLLLSLKFQRSYKAFVLIIFVTIITWYFTFDGILSLLPVITSLSGAYSFFFLEKIQLRLAMMFNSSIWLIYHISIWSVSWVMNESFTQVILIATVYRMLHPEWWSRYYTTKIKSFLWRWNRPDYDRFIFIHDRVSKYRESIARHFLRVIHCDLNKSFKNKRIMFCNKFLKSKVHTPNIDATIKGLHITK